MNALRLLGLGVALLVVTSAGRADDTDLGKQLVGKWEVTKADEGTVPVGSLVEFTKDGKMKITAKKGDKNETIEGTYKVEKHGFTMSAKIGDMEISHTITVTKISDKEMSTKDKDGKVVELKKK